MTDIPKFSGTLPSRRGQSQEQFDVNAENVLDWLVSLPSPIQAIVAEVIALADAQNYDPATTYNQAGYTKPSFVYGSDGATYVCIGENVIGDDPVGSLTGDWVRAILTVEDLADYATRKIDGGMATKTAANEVTISPCRCLDSSFLRELKTTIDMPVAIPVVANQRYHIFEVETAAGDIEFRPYATEEGLLADGDVVYSRWRMVLPTNGSGNLYDFYHDPGNDIIHFFPGVVVESGFAFGNRTLTVPFSQARVPNLAFNFPQAGNGVDMSGGVLYLDSGRTKTLGSIGEGNTGSAVNINLIPNPPNSTIYATFSKNPYTSVNTASWGYEAIQLKV
ncbi:MAG TPA: hypothetical protein DEB35_10030 [Desulfuromonas sp.]|nr:hypothetical protein [Desulfuromonas sp.]